MLSVKLFVFNYNANSWLKKKPTNYNKKTPKKWETASTNSFTFGGSDVLNWGIQACAHLCCNLQIWPAQHRSQEVLLFQEDSRSHRWGSLPSPAGRTASAWCPGSALQTHLLGRTWHGIWTGGDSPFWFLEQKPEDIGNTTTEQGCKQQNKLLSHRRKRFEGFALRGDWQLITRIL